MVYGDRLDRSNLFFHAREDNEQQIATKKRISGAASAHDVYFEGNAVDGHCGRHATICFLDLAENDNFSTRLRTTPMNQETLLSNR